MAGVSDLSVSPAWLRFSTHGSIKCSSLASGRTASIADIFLAQPLGDEPLEGLRHRYRCSPSSAATGGRICDRLLEGKGIFARS
jgi:hypothetical protein